MTAALNATTSICGRSYGDESHLLWLCVYAAIIAVTVVGNVLTIAAICRSRKLASLVSNQFVLSLAVSDLLVGCTIPYHMIYYLMDLRDKMTCLARFSFICFACSSSIHNVLLIAIDRYVAIVHPFNYYRCMTRKLSMVMIIIAWLAALAIGSSPFHWNDWQDERPSCDLAVLPSKYIIYCLTPLFILVWMAILAFYIRIGREADGHVKRMKNCTTTSNGSNPGPVLCDSKNNKSLQMVLLILGCFSCCWLPYIIIVTLKSSGVFCHFLYETTFALATANSAMNPLLYAWKNASFRQAFRCLLTCKSPNPINPQFITNYVPSKTNSLENILGSVRGEKEGVINNEEMARTEGLNTIDWI